MRLSILLGLLLVGCTGQIELVVEVRSDLHAGVEFATVQTLLDNGRAVVVPGVENDNFIAGSRVAEFGNVKAGLRGIRVELRDGSGALVLARDILVNVQSTLGVTVVLSRSCVSMNCPEVGGRSLTCHGGRCVAPECSSSNLAACGTRECVSDSECTSTECAQTGCAVGVCLTGSPRSRCTSGQLCVASGVCSALDGSADAGVDVRMDASVDAALDVSLDVGLDAPGGRIDICPSDPRLRACYPFDGQLTDFSANGNHLIGTVDYGVGIHGDAASLRGGGRASTPSSASLEHSHVTVQAWVFPIGPNPHVIAHKDHQYFLRLDGALHCGFTTLAGSHDLRGPSIVPTESCRSTIDRRLLM